LDFAEILPWFEPLLDDAVCSLAVELEVAIRRVAEDDGHSFAIGVEGELSEERAVEGALGRGEARYDLGGVQELEAVLVGELY